MYSAAHAVGGQSIPKFDYDLANGVKKTFKHKYYENIKNGLMYRSIEESVIDDIIKVIRDNIECEPCIDNSNGYLDYELNIIRKSNLIDADVYSEIQKTAYDLAIKGTDRDTYQAMEALIHNLNTMNSRAGAQVEI